MITFTFAHKKPEKCIIDELLISWQRRATIVPDTKGLICGFISKIDKANHVTIGTY